MRGASRLDLGVAIGLVLAGVLEAVLRDRGTPGLLAFNLAGALTLLAVAVRRNRPMVPLAVIATMGVVGTTVTHWAWPAADNEGGVWIFAMMLAAYSAGAYGSPRVAALGVLLPVVVVVDADMLTRSGWPRVSGIVFVTVFVGLLPTGAGRLARARNDRLRLLADQRDRIVHEQQARQEAAVLAERLRATRRLQPTLVSGLRSLARATESSTDPAAVELEARDLLARTRHEVVALTSPVAVQPPAEPPAADHVTVMRRSAQPWAVVAGGAVAAGLWLESAGALAPGAPWWRVLPAAGALGLSLALVWWRPVLAVALAWGAAGAYSRAVAPLDGSLSVAAVAFTTVFAVAALSRRWPAVVGLAVCLVGEVVGVGTSDPGGVSAVMVVCWFGGRGLHELSRLVEQARVHNELLAQQEVTRAKRAVVDERLRLAREIHDAIGHSLTVVALQAGAARRLAGIDPARAREVMATVAEVAHDGMAALLVEEGPVDLARLVERVAATGLVVEADLAAESSLPPEQRAVAFRVVQEALTNVLRHAPGARARVLVLGGADGVEVVVANTAPGDGGTGPGTGRGLAGLRERVDAIAGEVTWGHREDGGFEVRALLPASSAVEAANS